MSPLPVENLTNDSSDKEIQDQISASIEMCMSEKEFAGAPPSPKRCAAAAYSIAREKTGKGLKSS